MEVSATQTQIDNWTRWTATRTDDTPISGRTVVVNTSSQYTAQANKPTDNTIPTILYRYYYNEDYISGLSITEV